MVLVSLTDLRSVFVFSVVFTFRFSSISEIKKFHCRLGHCLPLRELVFVKKLKIWWAFIIFFRHFFIVRLVSLMPDVTFVENLSNRSSGVQIPWDICTRFGCYLYSIECS